MRFAFLPWLGALVALASLYFFYRGVGFLAAQDYVAALLTIFVGFALIKAGTEVVRISLDRASRRTTGEGRAEARPREERRGEES